MVRATIRNLAAGLKLALLLPVRGTDFRPTLAGSLFNVVLGVLVLAVFSHAHQQGDIYFNDFAAAFVGAVLFAALISAIAIVRARGSLDRLPELITPISSLFPWMVGFLSSLHLYLNPSADSTLPWSVALLWCVTIVIRSVRLAFEDASPRLLLGTAALMVCLAAAVWYRGYPLDLYYSYDDSEYDTYMNVDEESVFLSQARLLDDELARIQPSTPGKADVYFVGFAGNGDSPVFGKEASYVQERVAQRHPTAGRSLVLSSDLEKLDSVPLANTYNLFRTISAIGEKMDVKDDVLFLFLTSHGSADATIDVSMFPLTLKKLSAEDLRAALDEASIEWRVIVISACHSGSFIDPLKTNRTVIMTAAAADKTSFGCSKDRDLTYFGEALFRDAFDDGGDLFESFDKAKVLIGERERREGRSSSDPQIFVGSEIREKLAGLETLPVIP